MRISDEIEKSMKEDLILKATDEIASVFNCNLNWLDQNRAKIVKILKTLIEKTNC
jgi:hypothetical protein